MAAEAQEHPALLETTLYLVRLLLLAVDLAVWVVAQMYRAAMEGLVAVAVLRQPAGLAIRRR